MNKAFKKILERLDEEKNKDRSGVYSAIQCDALKFAYGSAKEIVQEVAGEYNNGWISVKDRLPNKTGSYLVIGKSGGATVTRWYMPSEFYPEGHFGGNSSDYIRYWMPRPEPPKERD